MDKIIINEIKNFRDPSMIDIFNLIKVHPSDLLLENDYLEKIVQCKQVSKEDKNGLCIVYDENGFSDCDYHWGIIDLKSKNVGTDAQWFSTLEDAIYCSSFWIKPKPKGFELN